MSPTKLEQSIALRQHRCSVLGGLQRLAQERSCGFKSSQRDLSAGEGDDSLVVRGGFAGPHGDPQSLQRLADECRRRRGARIRPNPFQDRVYAREVSETAHYPEL